MNEISSDDVREPVSKPIPIPSFRPSQIARPHTGAEERRRAPDAARAGERSSTRSGRAGS
jgi:hypothetical protein